MKQQILFFKKYLNNPKHIGSVAPSSRFLAERMLNAAPWGQVKTIVELGSGTGAITRALAQCTKPGMRVMLFEKDEDMRVRLQHEFPHFLCEGNAMKLVYHLNRNNIYSVDCIFSGLPFFNFSTAIRMHLIKQIHESLKPGGTFITFQYSLQMRKLLSNFFEIERISLVLLNFPPAFVYVCRKRGRGE
ncbi:class I SAM-dependent methyltransferase [Paenibacillus daejeonensis]|uniref:class I SAM-dependent methyltransferase n=1 Tax=Paenibacillus daejeonensis TaxID=135193 RepID=UPI00036DBCF8|nr:methyltransferase domain-containing protein [Paenibacillus daejeonensis]